jgi:integrase
MVQSFVSATAGVLAPSTLRMSYSVVAAVFAAAVRDRVIPRRRCASACGCRRRAGARSSRPTWPSSTQLAAALPERFRAVVSLVAGSGLRQGELFGLEVAGVDFLRRRCVQVGHQLVSPSTGAPYLGQPKTPESERTVPLAHVTLDQLAAHLGGLPAAEVEVEDRTDPRAAHRRSARPPFTLDGGRPVARNVWPEIWRPAARAAGLPPRTGLHVVRHWYASALIRHGASVKAVQARLGHSSAGVTLDVYGHLWPDDDDTTRDALTVALAASADSVRTKAGS